MRYTGPKVKKARRLQMPFTSKDVKVMQRRGSPPGQHGQNRQRLSEYGTQLREKQRAKILYGLQERQFSNLFKKALSKPGITGNILLAMLESRLDNVIFRLGLAQSRAQARQLVSHGFFNVNGKKVNIPSYQLKIGDNVSFTESKQKKAYTDLVKQAVKNTQAQEWLEFDPLKMAGKILTMPTPEMIDNKIQTQLIVEHYSRI